MPTCLRNPLLFAVVLVLAGCGAKGPLFLPEAAEPIEVQAAPVTGMNEDDAATDVGVNATIPASVTPANDAAIDTDADGELEERAPPPADG